MVRTPLFLHTLLMSRNLASIQIIIVENTPKESLGAANGLAQAVASGLNGVAPSVASFLFSISLERRLWEGTSSSTSLQLLRWRGCAFFPSFQHRNIPILVRREFIGSRSNLTSGFPDAHAYNYVLYKLRFLIIECGILLVDLCRTPIYSTL